ncbi:Winged helix-turn-helix transcription repressor DNA-binding [Penicillium taxi]|uniref:Winged helix-turn-helix transcription repressor DNA-binding n=1 Tax=Penicillium taxi TaxID=168475 RepID=UPI002544FEC9|nr:Winged helix-turn-helix transcription repressor DNA-binding [Penicillium taxi]KAJ5885429.1 Winged helix-turn-helix transcription repressor DNA-binding [Penicillium taxi]
MDPIIAQIQGLAKNSDEIGRLNIVKTLQRLQVEIQSPKDTLFGLAGAGVTIAMLRVSADLGLLRLLAKSNSPLTVDEIAVSTGASPQLLERILRYLASAEMIKKVEANKYAAILLTHILADPKGEGMIYHAFDTHGPVIQAMPDFFAENSYQDVTVNTNTPFQKAHNTKLTSFEWLKQHPDHFIRLQAVMTAMKGSEWTDGFSLIHDEAQKAPSAAPQPLEKPFFVDVGGGHGHQCIELGKRYPNLLGRLVLQDLPEVVDSLAPIEGVKTEGNDFFQKQPINGAKFYYLRRIMHDWPDLEAAKILRNIASAMGTDSRILIDETVLPETGAHLQSTMADIAMMTFGGKERTESQWSALAEISGLKIEQIHTYIASTYTAILVLAPQ